MASDKSNEVVFISRAKGLRVNLEAGRKMIDPHNGHFCSVAPISIKFKDRRFATSDLKLVEKLKSLSGYKKLYFLKGDAKEVDEREREVAEREAKLHKKLAAQEAAGIRDGGE